MAEPITIVLADDHRVFRAGLRALLDSRPDMKVVGEAGTGTEAVEMAERHRPDVVVMDLSMPEMSGLEATRRIAALRNEIRVLVLTMHSEEDYLLRVIDAGASGYITKTRADDDVIEAIRTAARGEVFLYPHATRMLLRRYRDAEPPDDELDRLTEREREVLALVAEGYTSAEIGEKLFISAKTVDSYRSRIMQKLGLNRRAELVQFALRTGLLRPE